MTKYWIALGFLAVLTAESAISQAEEVETGIQKLVDVVTLSPEHSKAEYIIEDVVKLENSVDITEAPEVVILAPENAAENTDSPESVTETDKRPSDRTVNWSSGSSWNVYIIMGIFILTNTIKLVPVGIAEIFKYKEAKEAAAQKKNCELNHVDSIESVLDQNLDKNIISARLPSVDTAMTDLSSIDKVSIKS